MNEEIESSEYIESSEGSESIDSYDYSEPSEFDESGDLSQESEESTEETIADESGTTQEVIVEFDTIQLSDNLNDIGLLGMALLIIILCLGLLNVWGIKE